MTLLGFEIPGLGGLTLWKGILAALVALPTVAAIVWRVLKRKDAKEAERASDDANKAADDVDPDRMGPDFRRGVRRGK